MPAGGAIIKLKLGIQEGALKTISIMNFGLEKLKSKTINSPHGYERKFWYVIATIFVITLIVLAGPFLLFGYFGYKAYYKSSWQRGERWGVITVLALMLALTGPPWVSAFFDGSQNQAETQAVNDADTQEVVNLETNTSNTEEIATTSTPSSKISGNQATTSTSSKDKAESSQSTSEVGTENSEESPQNTSSNQPPSQSAATTDPGSDSQVSEEVSVSTSADAQTQTSVNSQNKTSATITSVVDGDTADVRLSNGRHETLRLIGIDTPETQHPSKPVQCFGKKASQKAKEMLSGKEVTLEYDSTQGRYDKYNRLLTYIILPDGTNFNKIMIEEGYAYEYTYNTPYKYQDEFKEAERSAQVNERGLWAPDTCDGQRTIEDGSSTDESSEQDSTSEEGDSSQQSTVDGKWYASDYHTAEYYYHESCEGWEDLSNKYLQTYDSEVAAQNDNPDYELHPDCEVE